jgi:uncharacterized protein
MAGRFTHLDTVRGIAVMGILVMNSVSMGLGNLAYFDLSAAGSNTPLDWALGAAGEVFADQKFMGLFSLLFGASLLLFVDRVQHRSSRPVGLSLWRNALLFGIGCVHSLVWEGDVLTVYGLCAPVLLLLRNVNPRALVALGLMVFSVAPLASVLGVTHVDNTALVDVFTENENLEPSPAAALVIGQILVDLFCRALGMMMLGMGLYRSGWLVRPRLLREVRLAGVAVILGACLSALGVVWVAHEGFGLRTAFLGNLPNTLATPPMVIGYFVLLQHADAQLHGRWMQRVRALGRTALTNYLAQTFVFLSIVWVVPPDWVSRSTLWLAVAALWVLQLLASEAWLQHFVMGPLEWTWRCATYGKVEPLLR